MRLALIVMLVSLLLKITLPSSERARAREVSRNLTIFFSGRRAAETGMCGCASYPLGGIDREARALEQTRLQARDGTAFLVSGPTLASSLPETPNARAARARAVGDAMQALAPDALSLTGEDFLAGTETVTAFVERARFPVLSTNIRIAGSRKPRLKRFARLTRGTARLLIFGLSADFSSLPAEVVVGPAAEALGAALAEARPDDSEIIILLSSLSAAENRRLADAFPAVRLVLGTSSPELVDTVENPDGQTLFGMNRAKGRSLLRLDVAFPVDGRFGGFFNEELAETISRREDARARQGLAASTNLPPIELPPSGWSYEWRTILLDSTYAEIHP